MEQLENSFSLGVVTTLAVQWTAVKNHQDMCHSLVAALLIKIFRVSKDTLLGVWELEIVLAPTLHTASPGPAHLALPDPRACVLR